MPTEEEFQIVRKVHWMHLDERERKRQEAILEFITTEANYYQRLVIVHEAFYHECGKHLERFDREKIFQNLDELLLRSGLLLSDLRSLQSAGQGIVKSLQLFSEHMKNFDCFKTYCIGHGEGTRILSDQLKDNSRFAKLVKEKVNDPRCLNLDLTSFLLEPVQRLARYPLLLKQVLHYTPKDHSDHQSVLEILQVSEALLGSVNEAVRAYESRCRLEFYQNRLLVSLDGEENNRDAGINFELLGKTRKNVERELVMELCMCKAKSKRKLIALLCTDMLVLLEANGGKFTFYRDPLSIDEIVLREVDFDLTRLKLASGLQKSCCFEIHHGATSIIVAVESIGDKQRMFSEFEKLLSKASKTAIMSSKLDLPVMGTVLITVSSAKGLKRSSPNVFCALELNDQRYEMKPSIGPNPIWNQEIILSMASFDDTLYLFVNNYHKYAPSERIGSTELSLDLLEYYDGKMTNQMELFLNTGGSITITLQFHSA